MIKWNVISYYVFSLPISIVLAFPLGYNLEGLWIGMCVGPLLEAIFSIVVLAKTNWDEVSKAVAQRLAKEKERIAER